MRATSANLVIKAMGVVAILAGAAVAVLVLVRGVPQALPSSGWARTLVFAVFMLGFAGYLAWLGYSLLFHASRTAFERIFFLPVVFGIVLICQHTSSVAGWVAALGFGLLGCTVRLFISRYLFHDSQQV